MDTIKTIIHWYDFDTSRPDQRAAWEALRDKLLAFKVRPMRVYESRPGWNVAHVAPLDGQPIELQTARLFDNQWNTGPTSTAPGGLRVFDWHDIINPHSKHRKSGHWLKQTTEMRHVRRNRLACPYCGKQQPLTKESPAFCPDCLTSEYLKESDILAGATRLRLVSDGDRERDPVLPSEREAVLSAYREARKAATKENNARARADILRAYEERVAGACEERDGKLWCVDNDVPLRNVFFYTHAGEFHFGWRTPLDGAEVAHLLDRISEFRFPYKITCADGRVLEGNKG